MKTTRNQSGFTLVELLIVVAIIGIIAAIAIPNLLSAIQRGKQKRTMGDIKTLGTALEAYQTDANVYISAAATPAAIGNGTAGVTPLWGGTTTNLDPDYQKLPMWKDGWWSSQNSTANILKYGTFNAGTPVVPTDYIMCSVAKNNAVDGASGATPAGCTTLAASPYTGADGFTFDCDIVMIDGQFNQAPSGKQKNVSGCT
jgi:type II secretion system protein G